MADNTQAFMSSGIEPLTDFGSISPFDEEDEFVRGQKVLADKHKVKRANTRSNMLMALGAALSAAGSRDPGRVAAQFIEQQSRLRQRRLEMERREMEVKEMRRHQTKLQESSQDFQATESGKTREQQTKLQESSQDFQATEAGKQRTFSVEQQGRGFDHDLTMQEQRVAAEKGLTKMRLYAAQKRQLQEQGFVMARDKQQALDTMKGDLQRRFQEHIFTMQGASVDAVDAMSSSVRLTQFWAGEIPRSELTATDEATMDSYVEKESLAADVRSVTEQAQLMATVTEMATTVNPITGVGVFDQGKYDRFIGTLSPTLQAKLKDPQISAGVALNKALERAETDHPLSEKELIQLEEVVLTSGIPNGDKMIQDLRDRQAEGRIESSPEAEAKVGHLDAETARQEWDNFTPEERKAWLKKNDNFVNFFRKALAPDTHKSRRSGGGM